MAAGITVAGADFRLGDTYVMRGHPQHGRTLVGYLAPERCDGVLERFAPLGGLVVYRKPGGDIARMAGSAWASVMVDGGAPGAAPAPGLDAPGVAAATGDVRPRWPE